MKQLAKFVASLYGDNVLQQDMHLVPGPGGRYRVITTHDIAATWQPCHLGGCFPGSFPPGCLLFQPGLPSKQCSLSALNPHHCKEAMYSQSKLPTMA